MPAENNTSHLESRIEAIEKRNQSLEESVSQIKLRNREVEQNKSWENSWIRKLLIILFTYLSISLYLKFIVGIDPWVNAVVPSLGYLLSTLTLPYLKTIWVKYIHIVSLFRALVLTKTENEIGHIHSILAVLVLVDRIHSFLN